LCYKELKDYERAFEYIKLAKKIEELKGTSKDLIKEYNEIS